MATPITPGTFFLESNNKAWLEGKREHPIFSDHMGSLILALLLTVLGAGLTIMGFMEWSSQNRIYNSRVTAQGQVESHRESHNSENNATTYYVTYSFTINGVLYSREASVNEAVYDRAEYGSKINVYYMPEDPRLSILDNEGQPPFKMGIGALLTGSSIFLFVLGLQSISKEHLLFQNGKPIPGEVIHSRGYTDSENDYNLIVKYRFTSPDTGKLHTGKRSTTQSDVDKNHVPQAGHPLLVMYLDDKNYRVL